MKTRITGLVATAAVLAWAVTGLSIAATSQYSFDGSCSLHGTATFSPNLKQAQQTVAYHFKTTTAPSGPTNQNKCNGKLNGADAKDYDATAYVDGSGQLSCGQSTANGGKGAVTIVDGSNSYTFPAMLDINGAGTEVELHITQQPAAGEAYGHASFARYTNQNTPSDCMNGGVPSLQFDADFQDTSAFKADKPAPASTTSTQTPAGDQPVNTPPTSGGDQSTPKQQPQDQGGVKGERKSSPKKSKKSPCGKSHKRQKGSNKAKTKKNCSKKHRKSKHHKK